MKVHGYSGILQKHADLNAWVKRKCPSAYYDPPLPADGSAYSYPFDAPEPFVLNIIWEKSCSDGTHHLNHAAWTHNNTLVPYSFTSADKVFFDKIDTIEEDSTLMVKATY